MILRVHNPGRPGLTLLEVVVSMAIFLLSLVAIWQLFVIGGDRALDVKFQARTSLLCQSKLAEISVSPEPPSGSEDYAAFQDEANKDLQWKMNVDQNAAEGLWHVKVWVKADLAGRMIESHVSQMIIDPKLRGSTHDVPPNQP